MAKATQGKTQEAQQEVDPRTEYERKMSKADVATLTKEATDLVDGKTSVDAEEWSFRLHAITKNLTAKPLADLTDNAKDFLRNHAVDLVAGTYSDVSNVQQEVERAKVEAEETTKKLRSDLRDVTKKQELVRGQVAALSYRLTSLGEKQKDLVPRFGVSKGEMSSMVAAAKMAEEYQSLGNLSAVTKLIHRKQQRSAAWKAEVESGVSHEKLTDFMKAVDDRHAESEGTKKQESDDTDLLATLPKRLSELADELVKVNKAGSELLDATDTIGGTEAVKQIALAATAYLKRVDPTWSEKQLTA